MSPRRTSDIEVKTLVRQAGFRATKSRLTVLKALAESARPASIPSILRTLGRRAPDQATMYRMLDSFEKAGLVRQVNLRHGHADYELASRGAHHHHLVCTSCGQIEDFEKCGIENVVRRALRQSKRFSSVNDHALELFGVCKTCDKK